MDGAHDTGLDRCIVVESLSHGSQTVGGAGSCGNDGVILGQGLLIYAEYDGRQIIASRCRDNNLLGAGIDMSLRFRLGGIETSTLQNYVYTDLSPRKIRGILLCVDPDGLSIYGDGVFTSLNGMLAFTDMTCISALSSIILKQMSQHLRIGQIVDRHNLIPFRSEHLSECQTADTSKTIDCYFYCHVQFLLDC